MGTGYGDGVWGRGRTTEARPEPGGFRHTGRKVFATNSAVATHFSTTARWADAEGGPRLLLCQVGMDQPGVSVVPTWNTMAMRATRIDYVVLDGVFVPEDALGIATAPVTPNP